MPLKIPPRTPDPALPAAWSRTSTYAEKLLQSLDELGELGVSCKVAAATRWGPGAHDRAAGQLQAVLEAVEAELVQLELRRRHYPRRARKLG